MNFGQALEALKSGAKVTREGWNGKNMFLWLKKGTVVTADMCHDETLLGIAKENGGSVECLPTICIKTADNKVLTGWNASQADMLADDWQFYFDSFWTKVDVEKWTVSDDERVDSDELDALLDDSDARFAKALESENFKEKFVNEDLKESAKREVLMYGDDPKRYLKAVEDRDGISTLYSKIQRDVLNILNTAEKQDHLELITALEKKYLDEAKSGDEADAIKEAFTIFIDYARDN